VWICADPEGHIQATGRDARRRKQYRYHPRWREVRDETKYERMVAFGERLPQIRKRVAKDLSRPTLARERVLAAIVRLLDASLIRVGNEEYASENRSYGLTTMLTDHVDIHGGRVRFDFPGKSGKRHIVDVNDHRVARVLRRCTSLPGEELFQYLDEDGNRHAVGSDDVNDYLRDISGDDFTAKDFRTWAGTVLAACTLQEFGPFESQREARRKLGQAVQGVAGQLGNTPAVCRRCYIHPDVIEAHRDGSLFDLRLGNQSKPGDAPALSSEERMVLRLLRSRLRGPGR
jgi:DNA topoisomerase-1